MSFTVQGLPANVKYSADAVVSRISFEFTTHLNRRLLSASRSSILSTSITIGTSSAAFTCVLKFIIDPYMEDCDVILGSEWKNVCDAKCIIPLSLATLPVYEDSSSESPPSVSPDRAELPSVPPAATIRDDSKRGGDFFENVSGTSSNSVTQPEDVDAPFTYHSLPFYFQFRRRIEKSG